jgi:hypothetical protein
MVPNEVLKGIKVRAAVAWPGDYSMQAHVIGEQSEAFERISHYQTTLDMTNDVIACCMKRALLDWPDDFDMQVHVFDEQIEAAGDFFNAQFPEVPEDVLKEIRIRGFSEWPEDYSMMLHELTEQIAGWKSVNF